MSYERFQTQAERELFDHLIRWGSDGRPIIKVGHRWSWDFRGIQSPRLYKTKRECIEAWERYEQVLWDAHSYEVKTTGRYRPWYEEAAAMSPSELARHEWESGLRVGDRVVAAWGYGSGFRAHGPAEIVRINAKTYRVRLLEDVPYRTQNDGWPAGQEIGGLVRFTLVGSLLGGWHPDKAVHPIDA